MAAAKVLGKPPAFQFYPGDWLSSPDVILMTPAERGAYITLLATSWQSEPTAYLQNDEERLRRITQLTPKQWSESRSILLKKFPATEDGTLRYNPRLAEVAVKQEAYRKQMQANSLNKDGKPGGRPRKQNPKVPEDNPKVIPEKPEANLNETTLSLSLSSVSNSDCNYEVQEQKLVLSPSEKRTKPIPEKKSDGRHADFKIAFEEYFLSKNPGLSNAPWEVAEGMQLKRFLSANPSFSLEQWQRVLRNRSISPVTHGTNLSAWIKHALVFFAGPADDFGKQLKGANVYGHNQSNKSTRSAELVRNYIRKQEQQNGPALVELSDSASNRDTSGNDRGLYERPGTLLAGNY